MSTNTTDKEQPDLAERIADAMVNPLDNCELDLATIVRDVLRSSPELARVREALHEAALAAKDWPTRDRFDAALRDLDKLLQGKDGDK